MGYTEIVLIAVIVFLKKMLIEKSTSTQKGTEIMIALVVIISILFLIVAVVLGFIILVVGGSDKILDLFKLRSETKKEEIRLAHENEIEKMRLEHEKEKETWKVLNGPMKNEDIIDDLDIFNEEENQVKNSNKI